MVIFGVDPDPTNAEAITEWARGYWEALHPHSAEGAYINFMMEEGEAVDGGGAVDTPNTGVVVHVLGGTRDQRVLDPEPARGFQRNYECVYIGIRERDERYDLREIY